MVKIRRIDLFALCCVLLVSFTGQSHAEQYGPIKSGDILWTIAAKTRPDPGVSLHQMLIALLRENPSAFRNPCNFNTLKIGRTLDIPSLDKIKTISQTEAVAEFARQNEQWRNRQQEMTCSPLLEQSSQKPENAEGTATVENDKTNTTEENNENNTVPATAEESPPPETVAEIASTDGTAVETTETLNETAPSETNINETTSINETVEKPETAGEKPITLPSEEIASINGAPTDQTTPTVEENTNAQKAEVVEAQPDVVNTSDDVPIKITESIEEKTGFSLITVAGAVLIAVLILGLLAWLAFREKANKPSLRKKTEQAVLSNQYDKMNDDDKAGDSDAGLDLFAETLSDNTEQRRT